ncbi:MAG: hypothetical protein ACXWNC_00080 [Anaerolineales bacterium]
MKFCLFYPFVILASLVLLVGMACSLSTATPIPPTLTVALPTQMVAPPTNPPAFPTQLIPPTNPPATPTNLAPTATPFPSYFTETFQGDLSQWPYDVYLGDATKFSESQSSNGLHVELNDPDLYVYYYYSPVTYQDVTLDLTYTNLAHNSNNINLVCRNSKSGRFEFTVQNDGLYQIWAYDGTGGNGYVELADGGSTAIRSGQQQNQISAACVGNNLTLYINGSLVKSIKDTRFFFTEGEVGFGVNISPSNPVTPVIVDFESLTISQP